VAGARQAAAEADVGGRGRCRPSRPELQPRDGGGAGQRGRSSGPRSGGGAGQRGRRQGTTTGDAAQIQAMLAGSAGWGTRRDEGLRGSGGRKEGGCGWGGWIGSKWGKLGFHVYICEMRC
jgi:hypothetical protein